MRSYSKFLLRFMGKFEVLHPPYDSSNLESGESTRLMNSRKKYVHLLQKIALVLTLKGWRIMSSEIEKENFSGKLSGLRNLQRSLTPVWPWLSNYVKWFQKLIHILIFFSTLHN